MKKNLLTLLLFLVAQFAAGQQQLDLYSVAYTSSVNTTTWHFSNGCYITNNNNKAYAAGVNNTIKYSAGVPFTIHLPEGFTVQSLVISGYDNSTGTDAYIAEINGTTYEATDYVFPQITDDETTTKTYAITLDQPASGTLTFKPGGKQVCWIIKLYAQEPTPGIDNATPTSQMEMLDRGLVVLPGQNGGRFISWRLLGTDDYKKTSFDIKRDGETIASDLFGATSYHDPEGTSNNIYQVVTKVDGSETAISDGVNSWEEDFKTLSLEKPGEGYTPNDMSVGDVDGDGQYELFLKWDPVNSKDNSQNGVTDNVFIDCYKVSYGGLNANLQRLWRIDLGRNIRAGAHYTQFMVYDFDGDGSAEMMCKTAPGSKDGKGRYVNQVATDDRIKAADNTKEWITSSGRIDGGQEYLTVFKGTTGEAVHTIAYNPNRNTTSDLSEALGTFNWDDRSGKTDNHGYNRGERYLAAVAYIDGPDQTPAGIFCRGYYTYAFLWAVKFDGQHLVPQWLHASDSKTSYKLTTYAAGGNGVTQTFSSLPAPTSGSGSRTMYGNGNHNLSIADVDGDGCDEVIWGAAALDNDGKLLYATGFGHGDAIHLADLDPDRPGLEVFDVHEEKGTYSWDVHDAATGEIIFKGGNSGVDNGRGIAAQLEETYRGYYFSSSDERQQRSAVTGDVVTDNQTTVNFRIYWDGDLQDELLDGHVNSTTQYGDQVRIDNWQNNGSSRFRSISRTLCNGTKSTPSLQADIFGDWREELVVWDYNDYSNGSLKLYIYSSNVPTEYRVPTLMHDHVYRMGVAWQNVAYNQPPHVGYYMPDYLEHLNDVVVEIPELEFAIVDMNNIDLHEVYPSSSSTTYYLPVVDVINEKVGNEYPTLAVKFIDENGTETVVEESEAVAFHGQDYENATDASAWTTRYASLSLATDDETYGNYISLEQGGGSGPRASYTKLYESGNDFYQTGKYVVEFDMALHVSNRDANEVILFGEGATLPSSNNLNRYLETTTNYLFKMTGGANWDGTYAVQNATGTFTLSDAAWCHYEITVDKVTGDVAYVITKDNQLVTKGSYTIEDTNVNLNVQGIWIALGRANSNARFDNLSIHGVPTPVLPYAFTQYGTLVVTASMKDAEDKTASFMVGMPYIIDPESNDPENVDNYLPVFINDELCQRPLQTAETANAHLWRTGIQDHSTWASMVLPFSMTQEQVRVTFGENAVVANLVTSGGNSHSVLFETENGGITANVPFLIKGVTNASPFLVRNVECIPNTEPKVSSPYFDFIGNYVYVGEPIPFTTSDYFFTTNGLATVANDNVKMTFYGYRAYFHSLNGNVGNAVAVTFDTETAMQDIDAGGLAPDEVYTITGQRVMRGTSRLNSLPKGVYIVNGKKMTVK